MTPTAAFLIIRATACLTAAVASTNSQHLGDHRRAWMLTIIALEGITQVFLMNEPYSLTWVWACLLSSAGCLLLVGLLFSHCGWRSNVFSALMAVVVAIAMDWNLWRAAAPSDAVLALAVQQWAACYCLLNWAQKRASTALEWWEVRRFLGPEFDPSECPSLRPTYGPSWPILWAAGAMLPPLSWLLDDVSLLDGLWFRSCWDLALMLWAWNSSRRNHA